MNYKKYKNFIVTIASSTFLLYTLTILDFLSIGSNLYMQESHNVNLESFNMIVFTTTTVISQIIFGGLSHLRGGICGGAIFESASMTRDIHKKCNRETVTATESLTTAYTAILISTLLFGLLSFLLGLCKAGFVFSYIPRTPLFGVMAAIGARLIKDGLDEIKILKSYITFTSAICTILLVLLAYHLEEKWDGFIFFIPLYTCTVLVLFYCVFFICGCNLEWLRDNYLVPELSKSKLNVTEYFKYIDMSKLNTSLLLSLTTDIISLSFANMIHITVNVPGFSNTMNISYNINEEFKTQGIANFLTGLFGFPTYFINCTSIYFNKSGGTTKLHSILGGLSLLGVIYIGPLSRQYLPRILLAFIPVYIGGSFVRSNLLEHIGHISLLDLLLILVTAIIGFINPVGGLLCGCLLQSIIVYRAYKKNIEKDQEADEFYNMVSHNYKVISVDYMVCFYTKDKFRNQFEDLEDTKTLIDLRNCRYIDYEGNMNLYEYTKKFKENILIIGSPDNFYKDKFKNIYI